MRREVFTHLYSRDRLKVPVGGSRFFLTSIEALVFNNILKRGVAFKVAIDNTSSEKKAGTTR